MAEMLSGVSDDEDVIWRGEVTIFAIGAHCTHYHAPLRTV